MLKIMMTPLTKKMLFISFSLLFFLTLHLLFTHHFTYPTQLSPMLYPGLTILLTSMYGILACLLFMRVYCDSKRFYLIAVAFGFSGSALFTTGTLISFPGWFTSDSNVTDNYNNAAIFFLFRQILLSGLCCFTALLYAAKAKLDCVKLRRTCLMLIAGFTLVILSVGYLYSSFDPSLSLSLIDNETLDWEILWHEKIGYLMLAIWFITLGLIIHVSQIKTLLWLGIAILCVAESGTLIIILTNTHATSTAWFYSRLFDVFSTGIILLVLLTDVFRLYQRSYQNYQLSYHKAMHDPLSGLYNRSYLFEHIQQYLLAASEAQPVSIVLCDLDHFKKINDRYGHVQGDKVIRFIGQQLMNSIRNHDIAARLGGEEFILVLNTTNNVNAMNIACRIQSAIAERSRQEVVNGLAEPVTMSMGVYTVTEANCTIEECLERADQAMYRAKKEGRNRVVNYH
ncbi:GGDEF domain-containing protein [Atlantibacter subterranea]|uniref:sensor domain-containing diguanylate cyclase n=1 Tax=Atlantibacter subterraneus TaxID=255519 RepID=UPI0011831C1C|nr:GGDEF domain-containing protein [Atlantibacter subterranea]TSJ51832.1 GGDEF domain-containing protein [Atlantibacter subterranea]